MSQDRVLCLQIFWEQSGSLHFKFVYETVIYLENFDVL